MNKKDVNKLEQKYKLQKLETLYFKIINMTKHVTQMY